MAAADLRHGAAAALHARPWLRLLVSIIALTSIAYRKTAAQGSPAAEPGSSAQEGASIALARELLSEVHCFWSHFGPDTQRGGFHATLDR